MPVHLADRPDAELEHLLRAALAARSLQIDEHDLRPARPPILPTGGPALPRDGQYPTRSRLRAGQRAHRRRGGRRTPALAIAATAAGVLVATGVATTYLGRSPAPPTVASGPATSGPATSGPAASDPTASDPADSGPPPVMATPPQGLEGLGSPSPTVRVIHVTPDPATGPRVNLTLTPTTEPVTDTAATVSYPLATVSPDGGRPARQWAETINARITALRAAFRSRMLSGQNADVAGAQTIDVRADAQWGHTLSIVLNNRADHPGQAGVSTTTAVVLDKRTGQELAATDLFTDVAAVDTLMRKAIQASLPRGTTLTPAVRKLSMQPGQADTTNPLTWYPTPQGLRWTVDPGVLTTAGQPEATVGWDTLTELLTRARP